MDDFRFCEVFAVAAPEQYFRVMPVGKFQRFGRRVDSTPDKLRAMVDNFRTGVPETGIPVTVEHKSEKGKVGDVASLDLRGDGLYARVVWNDTGKQLLGEGLFQYFSPEIVWGPTDYNDAPVSNVMVGLSLVNTPFFGKQTALFSLTDAVEQQEPAPAVGRVIGPDSDNSPQEANAMDENKVAEGVFDKLKELFNAQPQRPAEEPEPMTLNVLDTEEYKAVTAKLAALEAEKEEMTLKAAHEARVQAFSLIFGEERGELVEAIAKFAAVDEEAAEKLGNEFTSLYAQVKEGALFEEMGRDSGEEASADPEDVLVARAYKLVEEGKAANVTEGLKLASQVDPEMANTYRSNAGKVN